MLNQSARERFAPLFGWQHCNGICCNDWVDANGLHRALPDFSDIRSPYFGPMVEVLLGGPLGASQAYQRLWMVPSRLL